MASEANVSHQIERRKAEHIYCVEGKAQVFSDEGEDREYLTEQFEARLYLSETRARQNS